MLKKILLFLISTTSLYNNKYSITCFTFNNNLQQYKIINSNKLLINRKNNNMIMKLRYRPIYKTIFKTELLKTIKFKTFMITFLIIRFIYSVYSNFSDIICILYFLDYKDTKDIKHIIDIFNFINMLNLFNIFTFLEVYDTLEYFDISETMLYKKILIYMKYIKKYQKDCFIINKNIII